MKETTFIEQNKDKWKRFEELSQRGDADPDELSELFVQITDDLAYARTHYPKRSVRVYLNQLAQGVYTDLHKGNRHSFRQFISFFVDSLPLEMYRIRKQLLLSFLIMLAGTLIGIISTADNPDFFSVIMGDGYVSYTDQNIENADPMGVYKDTNSTLMFLEIMYNNLRVSFLYYVLGILFGVGTMLMILYTGLMIGSFHYYMYGAGYLGITLQTVWLHGTLEIAAIIIAGAAGVVLGNGLAFPGSHSRGLSLRLAARKSLKIMIGLIPVLMLAAFIEGYLTRQTEMDFAMKMLIIIGSLIFVLGYFVIYPLIRFRNHDDSRVEESVSVLPEKDPELHKTRSTGELFTSSFTVVRRSYKFFKKALWPIFFAHICFILFVVFYADFDFNQYYGWRTLLGGLFGHSGNLELLKVGVNAIFFALYGSAILTGFRMFRDNVRSERFWPEFSKMLGKAFPVLLVIAVLGISFVIMIHHWGYLLLFLVAPTLLVPAFASGLGEGVLGKFGKGFSIVFKEWGAAFMIFLALSAAVIFAFFLLHPPIIEISPLFGLIEEFINWHTVTETNDSLTILNAFRLAVYLAFFYCLVPVFLLGFGLLYYSILEKEEAPGLRERMKEFGKEDRVFET